MMDWKVGDWCIFDLRIGQIKWLEVDGVGFDEFSDGSIRTSGSLADRFRPLTLHNKCTVEYFDYYYSKLRELNGEAGFNYPDISRHFNQLALDAIDEGDDGDQKVPREKAEQFFREARDYKPVIQGVPLFRQNLRAPAPLDEDGLRLLVDQRDAEIEGLKKVAADQAKTIDCLLAALRKYEPDPLATNRVIS